MRKQTHRPNIRWLCAGLVLGLVLAAVSTARAGKPAKPPKPNEELANPALLYVSDGNLWHITADGAQAEMLVRDRDIRSACWVPDGSAVALVRQHTNTKSLVARTGPSSGTFRVSP